jgi:hypothetical protein
MGILYRIIERNINIFISIKNYFVERCEKAPGGHGVPEGEVVRGRWPPGGPPRRSLSITQNRLN